MDAKTSAALSLTLLTIGVFVASYFATAPIIGGGKAFIIATVISCLAAIAVAIAYLLGRDTAQRSETPVQMSVQTSLTPADVARSVVDRLEVAGLAYDPELIGPRLTTIQAQLAELATQIASLRDQLGRRLPS